MRTVEWKGRTGPQKHHIYTQQEADSMGVPYVPNWRDAEREGQWVLTDDGMVVEVLKIGLLRGSNQKWLRTATGSFVAHSSIILDTSPRPSRYTFNGKEPRSQPQKITRRMRLWIQTVAHGKEPVDSYLQIFGTSNRLHASQRVMKLLDRPEVMKAMKEELKPILKSLNIDPEYILRHYKQFIEDEDLTDNVRFKCLSELAEIVEVKETDPRGAVRGQFIGFGEVADVIEAGGSPGVLAEGQKALPAVETLEEDYPEE